MYGAIIGDIPMVDQVDIGQIRTGDWVVVDGDRVTITPAPAAAGS